MRARLDELMDACRGQGPQPIEREGAIRAVMVSMAGWIALMKRVDEVESLSASFLPADKS
jgi:hypothetical protein